MENKVEGGLKPCIQLAEKIRNAVEQADSFKQECTDLNRRIEKLGNLLRKAVRLSTGGSAGVLYEHPTRRIAEEVEKNLNKALELVKKCKKSSIIKRVMTITSGTDFRRVNLWLDNSIGDLVWLLTISAGGEDAVYAGLPPIAANDPNLSLIWVQIARVQAGPLDERAEGASTLVKLCDSERNAKFIVEEGGLGPLVKLLLEGTPVGQIEAAKALGELARDQQRVHEIVKAGAVQAFIKILMDGTMKVQTQVATAIARMADHDAEAQEAKNAFGAGGAIRYLVTLLSYDTIEEPTKPQNPPTMHTIVKSVAQSKAGAQPNVGNNWDEYQNKAETNDGKFGSEKPGWLEKKAAGYLADPSKASGNWPQGKPKGPYDAAPSSYLASPNHHHSRSNSGENGRPMLGVSQRDYNRKEREQVDAQTVSEMKAEVAHALWKLAVKNVRNCKSITDTRALLCFAQLIEKETGEVQKNSIMAVMEIAAAAEEDQELKRAAFKMNSPSVRAIVEQLLRVIETGEPELQVCCLKAIGCIARIFPAKEVKVLHTITAQLASNNYEVEKEAAIALGKFTEKDNFLCQQHSKAILEANGASYLVQLVLFEGPAQVPSLILLCNIAVNAGEDDSLKKADALSALKQATRSSHLMQIPDMENLVSMAIEKLGLYQSDSRGGHYDLEVDTYY